MSDSPTAEQRARKWYAEKYKRDLYDQDDWSARDAGQFSEAENARLIREVERLKGELRRTKCC